MSWTNYHSHSQYCDGTDRLETYLHEAIRQRVKVYGFSSHAPITVPIPWTMAYDKVAQYLEEGQHLKEKFRDLMEVYLGMEVDFIPGVTGPTSSFIRSLKLDYIIGSIHFVDRLPNGQLWEVDGKTSVFREGIAQIFGGNVKKAVRRYFELTRQMLEEQCPEIVGHLDKIKIHNRKEAFFSETEDWYQKEIQKTLKALAKSGAILEVNTRGIYKKKSSETYPSPWVLELAHAHKIPVMINSDAHHPSEITAKFKECAQMLHKIGFKELKILKNNQWQNVPFDEQGLRM
ncbi:MAG: histidinol-phosphatase HisJ [Microscillaceae bacterium]|nr:histidinol-phosphatase HisJ [Microscillaceae bacterium]